MEPEPSLEIQDAKHHVLGTFPTIPMCNGHGWGPFTIPKGKAQRMFNELAGLHPAPPIFFSEVLFDLPGPGVYYLVSVWSPNVLEALDADAGKTPYIRAAGRVGKVYGTARSLPVRVEFTAATNR